MTKRLSAFVAMSLAVSCGGSSASMTGAKDRPSALLQVKALEVLAQPSYPYQVVVRVMGVVPDSCTTVGEVRQARDGNTITVTITTARRDEACAQVETDVTERVRIEGGLPSGDYLLRVNGVEKRFTL